jgi:hypothetical protein
LTDIETWFEEPAPPPLPAEPAPQELVILDEPVPEVPVVRPAAKPVRVEPTPVARPRPGDLPWPARADEPIERPKPQIGLAMVILLLLLLGTCGGVFVITYAIWAGFKRFTPKRAEAPPALVVACTVGPGRVA